MDTPFYQNQKIQNLIFHLALFTVTGLIAWLSWHYSVQFDWTVDGRNTLSSTSQKLLKTMGSPISVVAYARNNQDLRKKISRTIDRFRRFKPDLTLSFINPDEEPDTVRALGIHVDGQMIIHYDGRSESLKNLNESAITNTLYRLSNIEQRWIVFLAGHGERSPTGLANHDLGQFGKQLQNKGYRILELKTAVTGNIPDNASLLVIAGPVVRLLPKESDSIDRYVENGGNLLWLQDSKRLNGLESLNALLGVQFLPGIVVDASSRTYGIDNPAFVTLGDYPAHPITDNIQSITLFPKSGAIEHDLHGPFEQSPLLISSIQSWSENGPIKGHLQFNPDQGEKQGPLTIGMALSRETESAGEPAEQRIVVVGDGDFLSNTYIGNGANLDLGLNMVQWLTDRGNSIDIPVRFRTDQALNLTPSETATMGIIFLIAIPILLIFTGFLISRRRRRA